MNLRISIGVAIGLVTGLVVLLVLLFAREHQRAEDLNAAKQRLCISQRLDLDMLLKHDVGVGDVRTRVRFDVADESTSLLCLGVEIPVSFEEADTCWINYDDVKRCYDEPLRQLRDLYRRRYP